MGVLLATRNALVLLAATTFVVTASLPASAEEAKLAVTGVRGRLGVDEDLVRVVEEYIVNQVARIGRFTVFGRDDITRLLDSEQQEQLSGCDEDSCLAEIGGAMGVDHLMAGSIDEVGESMLISLKIIDVRRGRVMARESERLRGAGEDDALEAIDKLLRRLFHGRFVRKLPKLAVTEVRTRRGVDSVLSRVVEGYLAGEIAKTGLYEVIDREDIQRMVAAGQHEKLDDCETDVCWFEIGGALGAKKLVAGSIDRIGSHLLVTLKVIDVKQAKVTRRESQKIKGVDEEAALDAVTRLYRRLFQPELAAVSAAHEDGTARARYRRSRGDAGGDASWVADEDAEPPPAEDVGGDDWRPLRAPALVPVGPSGSSSDAELLAELDAEAEAGVDQMPAVDVPGEGIAGPAASDRGESGEPAPGAGRFWTWIVATVGVASLGAGTGLEIVAAKDGAEVDDLLAQSRRGETVSWAEVRDLQDSEKKKGTAGHVLLGLGGALAVTAVVLFFVEAPDEAEQHPEGPKVGLAPLLGDRFGGLGLGGSF